MSQETETVEKVCDGLRAHELVLPPRGAFEYCIMFRWKRTNEKFRVINWSVGSHRNAYKQMRSMQRDYHQYEYCIGVRLITDWRAA